MGAHMATKISLVTQLILALAIFYLGYTIHHMTNKVGEIVETYPQVIGDINTLSENLQINEWLVIAKTLEQFAPTAIKSIDNAIVVIGETNKTAASFDAKIPTIVQEVNLYRQSVIPSVVQEAKHYRTSILPQVLVESKGYRTNTIPQVIKESQALRKEIPPILTKAEQIVEKSDDIAHQATKGALQGVIMSPIDLIKDAGQGLKGKVTPNKE